MSVKIKKNSKIRLTRKSKSLRLFLRNTLLCQVEASAEPESEAESGSLSLASSIYVLVAAVASHMLARAAA
jgi:hypothetical protein